MSQTATACLWRRGFLFRGCLLSTALRAILLSFGRGDGGRFKRPASCGSGSVHQTWLRPSILNTIYPILKGPIVKKRENDGRMPRRPRCRRACCIFLSNPAISMSTLLNGWVTYILNSCFLINQLIIPLLRQIYAEPFSADLRVTTADLRAGSLSRARGGWAGAVGIVR